MTAERPLVSVVLPTYDRPSFLAEAIESVREQTYEPIELLVVDGAPSAETEARVAGPDAEDLAAVSYLRQTASTGAAAARNLGIDAATGRYVAFLDDDDRWLPSKVERQVEACADDDVGMVYTGMRYEGGAASGRGDFSPGLEGDVTRELLCGNFVGSFSRVMVDRGAIEAAGRLDERFDVWEDWEWFVRLSRVCSVAAVDEPLTLRRGGHGESQLSHDVARMYREAYPLFVEACRPIAAEYGRLFERRFLGCVNFRLGWAALMRGEYGIARRTLARAVYWYPASPRFLAVLALALGGPTARRAYAGLPDAATSRVGRWLRRWT